MGAITLAEIEKFLATRGQNLSSSHLSYDPVSCPLNNQSIFCSNCGENNWEKDKLIILEKGWRVKHGVWYCPRCVSKIK